METIYSIIIPSKNTPALLERCVLSIPEREDTEIIVIDDNSGYTVEIEKSEFISRKNLHFIKLQESKGAGYARNISRPWNVSIGTRPDWEWWKTGWSR